MNIQGKLGVTIIMLKLIPAILFLFYIFFDSAHAMSSVTEEAVEEDEKRLKKGNTIGKLAEKQMCSCVAMVIPVDKAVQAAGAVFAGKVALVESKLSNDHYHYVAVGLRWWKGRPNGDDVLNHGESLGLVINPSSQATCNYQFKSGENYLIYADENENGTYRVNQCGRTRLLSEAEEDLKKLGEPENTINNRAR